jgi:translation elongation factor P/translation initiation factor 5A
MSHAQALFPGAVIEVTYAPEEIIHLKVDDHRHTFEIGSDDDEYVFTDGATVFTIPLMDINADL